ncbi:MAG: hypothetical protein E4H36_15770, partial [Spirochaetales bacterium]
MKRFFTLFSLMLIIFCMLFLSGCRWDFTNPADPLSADFTGAAADRFDDILSGGLIAVTVEP